MATGAGPVRIRTATHFSLEKSHRETSHRGRTFHPPWAFVGFTATLRYEPCTQFINVSQRTLHIYWQFSAMSLAIHKIVSKRRCQSYFISRRSPHHGISKDSDLCASAHRCLYYAYARLIARVNSQFTQSQSVSDIHSSFLFGSSMPDSPDKSDSLGYPDPAYAELRVEEIALHQPNW